MRALTCAAVFSLASCAATTGAVTNAAIGTAIGLTAAGISRSSGGCYASCPTGTACNASNGMCEELPCRGTCGADETCDMNRAVPACISAREPELRIGRSNDERARVTPQ